MLFKRKHRLDENIIKEIYKKGRLKRWAEFLLGVLIVAIAYNLFLLPAKVVYGVGGLGIIFNSLFKIDPSLVILVSSVILLFLSLILLGKEETKKTVIGSLLYPVFVKLTSSVGQIVDLSNTDPLLIVLFGAVISGFGLGLIFKAGFTTGGTDILNQIVSKYFKMSMGNSMFFTDGIIILSSVFVFGWTKIMYSIISLYIISIMTDKVILGISNSKAFYIITDHEEEVKKFVLKHLSHGVTILDAKGGFTGQNQKVIMCIIPTKEYFIAKEGIHEIDSNAFFVVTDAYEVSGGA
ncbi:MAG: YitT family protein [Bacilli bacterium]|jgi:uncharacterized membrane-anchored protein YitT (DUF2179 family)